MELICIPGYHGIEDNVKSHVDPVIGSSLKNTIVVPLVSMANQNDDLGKLLLDGLQLTSVEYEVARRN